MRFRVLITLAATAALLALPALAGGASAPTTLKVRSCQTGESSKARLATFYARMRSVPGASRLWMRFTLIDRTGGGASLVPTPKLAKWRKSRVGVKSFGFTQTITGLEPGAAYAANVEYRWRDERGRTIKSARRTSADCRQDGELPNLSVPRITAKTGGAPGTALYLVDVSNRGAAEARALELDLVVDGASADAVEIDLIEPGETVTVKVTGPACRQRVRAVVDRADAVRETTEDDNVRHSRCPALGS
jgi:hypothetical protein